MKTFLSPSRTFLEKSQPQQLGRFSKSAFIIAMIFANFLLSTQASAQSTGDYRTRTGASGSWLSNSIWQRYSGGNWNNVTTTPTSSDGAIDIRSDASITASSAITVDQLTVNGTLTFNNSSGSANSSFTLNNGSGTDMTINGTFINSATGTFAALAVSTGATWSVSSGGHLCA